jgi:hypothetical protein
MIETPKLPDEIRVSPPFEVQAYIIETCRQQNLHVLTFLAASVQAYLSGQPAPTIFPTLWTGTPFF